MFFSANPPSYKRTSSSNFGRPCSSAAAIVKQERFFALHPFFSAAAAFASCVNSWRREEQAGPGKVIAGLTCVPFPIVNPVDWQGVDGIGAIELGGGGVFSTSLDGK
jgi:hypothetical protein